MKILGWITAYGLWVVLSVVWSGYVLSVLWTWFIVTQFEQTPRLSVAGAWGIALIVRYLTYHETINEKDGTRTQAEKFAQGVFTSFCWPLFALIFGYIVRGFV